MQEDAWYAASSLVGSMASLGEAHIDAMGGMKLVKPLFLVLRRGARDCKAAALRALQHLTTERACRAMTARVRPLLCKSSLLTLLCCPGVYDVLVLKVCCTVLSVQNSSKGCSARCAD